MLIEAATRRLRWREVNEMMKTHWRLFNWSFIRARKIFTLDALACGNLMKLFKTLVTAILVYIDCQFRYFTTNSNNMASVIFIQISKFQIAYANKNVLFVVGRITYIGGNHYIHYSQIFIQHRQKQTKRKKRRLSNLQWDRLLIV